MPEVFGLYLILTNPKVGYEHAAEAAVTAGLRYLQLRIKDQPDDAIFPIAEKLHAITRGSQTRFIVNDSVELAKAVDADGVHLGQDDIPLNEARKLWPVAGKLFGMSTHGEEQELAARAFAPDLIGVGPVFATPTKAKPDPTLGLERMGAIIRSSPLTCTAIGGINAGNLRDVLRAGARNFAVVRDVGTTDDPLAAIEDLMAIWREEETRRAEAAG